MALEEEISLKLNKKDRQLIRNFNNVSDFLKQHQKESVYSLTPYVFHRLIHEVYRNNNIIILEDKYNYQNPLRLIENLIFQYDEMYKNNSRRLEGSTVVFFDYDDEINREFINKGRFKDFSNLKIIQFNSEIYRNLFVIPERTNSFVWYNLISEVLKIIFKLKEIEALKLETLLLNNYPFEEFISQEKSFDNITGFGSRIDGKLMSIFYHLIFPIEYHTHLQEIVDTDFNFKSFDQLKDGIYLVKFPITFPIFLRKIISSLSFLRYILKNFMGSILENRLVFILEKPNDNFCLELLEPSNYLYKIGNFYKIPKFIPIIDLSRGGKTSPKVIRLCARHRVQDMLH